MFRFFAESWRHPQPSSPQILESISCKFQQRADILCQSLPSCFAEKLRELCTALPSIFPEIYPLVLTHTDLCEMNILVNPDHGTINEIIDWADAEILPFGVSLWGLENALGYMDSNGWYYYSNHVSLEALFWQIFEEIAGPISNDNKKIIHAVRSFGFFLRYGFTWDDGVRERPVKESDSSLIYLDAYLATKKLYPNGNCEIQIS
jgi:hypothetical protein